MAKSLGNGLAMTAPNGAKDCGVRGTAVICNEGGAEVRVGAGIAMVFPSGVECMS